ncbi:uncharacterized protein LOC117343145 [Pecten maximus]|uniref:uncharacterized protein LOC117343145 n=1 Tax=Pecten maximus TaxID=6579 RepID=UPI001458253F|nr:uncharacterized protein LOC117343145 [Pecten maximus]
MEAWNTNNDPKVIAGYYIRSVQNKDGCPERLRADAGTENGYVRQMQSFLREDHVDRFAGVRSFMYGRSTANQKIESFWCIFRKEVTAFWMDLFKQLQDDNYFIGDFLDKNLIQFCLMDLIQADIDSTITVWNCHRIRPSKMTALPCGRPALMYSIPELYGVEDGLKAVEQDKLEICESECRMKDDIPCDKDVFDLCNLLVNENEWNIPVDPYEMCDLYIQLRNQIKNSI